MSEPKYVRICDYAVSSRCRTWTIYSKPVAAIRVDLAAKLSDLNLWDVLFPADDSDEFLNGAVEETKGVHALFGLFLSLIVILTLEFLDELGGLLGVDFLG